MPEQKGRKRRPRDRRRDRETAHDAGARRRPDAVPAPPAPAASPAEPGVPSPTARATGFLIAVITAFLAGLMIVDAPNAGGVEAVIRILTGVALVIVAVVVGVLVLFPVQLRRWVRGE